MQAIDRKYPIGTYQAPNEINQEILNRWIDEMEAFPHELEKFAKGMSEEQLSSPYREGSWTGRQVIQHLFDSHMHCYIRFKAALTEGENPEIKDYDENGYANLFDGKSGNIQWSLDGLKALHGRWAEMMRSFSPQDWKRSYFHPTRQKTYVLDNTLGIYAHHSKHHLAHLKLITGDL